MKLSQRIAHKIYGWYSARRADDEYRHLVRKIRQQVQQSVEHHTTWIHSPDWMIPSTQAMLDSEERRNNFSTIIPLDGYVFRFVSSVRIIDGKYHYRGTFWRDDTLTNAERWANMIDAILGPL